MRQHALETGLDHLGREELGERGGDRLQEAAIAHEMHIGVDREARAGEDAAGRGHLVAGQAERVGEREPARDAALALARAVVIDEALAPGPAQRRILDAGEDRGVLDRDARLVPVAVQRPGLDLRLGATPFMQPRVKRMLVVVARGADRAEARLELVRRKHRVQNAISMPSYAISNPAASTKRRSGEPSIRIGFVLLMWI